MSLALVTPAAQAETRVNRSAGCGSGKRPWVQIDFDSWNVSPAARERALEDLRVSLQDVGISACFSGASPENPSLAVIRVSVPSNTLEVGSQQQVVVTVGVRDAVTSKTVSREIDLGRFPEGARELALAIAADELLRASWAEMSLTTEASARAEKTAPSEVKLAVHRVQKTPTGAAFALGGRAAVASYQGGQQQIGGDVLLEWELPACFTLSWALGYRRSFSEKSPLGTVAGQVLVLEPSLGCVVWRGSSAQLRLGVSSALGRVSFSGEPNAASRGTEYGAWFAYGRVELTPEIRLSKAASLPISLTVGAPFRSVTALGQGSGLTAMSGIELGASLGFKVSL